MEGTLGGHLSPDFRENTENITNRNLFKMMSGKMFTFPSIQIPHFIIAFFFTSCLVALKLSVHWIHLGGLLNRLQGPTPVVS